MKIHYVNGIAVNLVKIYQNIFLIIGDETIINSILSSILD